MVAVTSTRNRQVPSERSANKALLGEQEEGGGENLIRSISINEPVISQAISLGGDNGPVIWIKLIWSGCFQAQIDGFIHHHSLSDHDPPCMIWKKQRQSIPQVTTAAKPLTFCTVNIGGELGWCFQKIWNSCYYPRTKNSPTNASKVEAACLFGGQLAEYRTKAGSTERDPVLCSACFGRDLSGEPTVNVTVFAFDLIWGIPHSQRTTKKIAPNFLGKAKYHRNTATPCYIPGRWWRNQGGLECSIAGIFDVEKVWLAWFFGVR